MSVELAVLQCGQDTCVYTVLKECGHMFPRLPLNVVWMSVYILCECSQLHLELSTCDRITQDGCLYQALSVWSRRFKQKTNKLISLSLLWIPCRSKPVSLKSFMLLFCYVQNAPGTLLRSSRAEQMSALPVLLQKKEKSSICLWSLHPGGRARKGALSTGQTNVRERSMWAFISSHPQT